jgi:hypothetical protein
MTVPGRSRERCRSRGRSRVPIPTVSTSQALEQVSRRMEDLARALGCLGYFDDDDRPRAA